MAHHTTAQYKQQLCRLTNLMVSKQAIAFDLSFVVLQCVLDLGSGTIKEFGWQVLNFLSAVCFRCFTLVYRENPGVRLRRSSLAAPMRLCSWGKQVELCAYINWCQGLASVQESSSFCHWESMRWLSDGQALWNALFLLPLCSRGTSTQLNQRQKAAAERIDHSPLWICGTFFPPDLGWHFLEVLAFWLMWISGRIC